eukprot:TRINITY_DN34943_c0_g1_i1.p1 TRINITY_DN34943_c0_g1~~TRINITY_DN34943_c0_g1_i1.p1  ORF type:complete len:419 (+),score=57.86 TRINITY_DN34943_c0_g1_i1:51-1259(+)
MQAVSLDRSSPPMAQLKLISYSGSCELDLLVAGVTGLACNSALDCVTPPVVYEMIGGDTVHWWSGISVTVVGRYTVCHCDTECQIPSSWLNVGTLFIRPPVTALSTTGQITAPGGTATSAASVAGLPKPLLEWRFDDAQLAETSSSGTYTPSWVGSTVAMGSGSGLITLRGSKPGPHHLDLLGADPGQVWVPGKIGGAARFDGVQVWGTPHGSVQVSAESLGLPGQEVTLAAWVKVATFKDRAGLVGFFQDAEQKSGGWALMLAASGRAFFAVASQLSGEQLFRDARSLSTPPFPSGAWHHLAGTYDGLSARLFLDGVEVDSRLTGQLDRYHRAKQDQNHTLGQIRYFDSYLAVGALRDDDEHVFFQGNRMKFKSMIGRCPTRKCSSSSLRILPARFSTSSA